MANIHAMVLYTTVKWKEKDICILLLLYKGSTIGVYDDDDG